MEVTGNLSIEQIGVDKNSLEHFGEPNREEFYVNYPSFKYWKQSSTNEIIDLGGINIYIHIPFCIQICDFCFYMKELAKSKEQIDSYIDNVCKEIEIVSDEFGLKRKRINSIYMGGGTPSILTQAQFDKIISTLHRCHTFDQAEFTFEAEPGTFTASKLKWYKNGGVSRVSMGVQSFDNKIISLSHRKHTEDQALKSINMVKEEGGMEVNIDLLSGLEGEDSQSWEYSIHKAIECEVDLLTIYKMKAYANTAVFKGLHDKLLKLPSKEEELQFMSYALTTLESEGYKMWSTFAFTRNEHKHVYAERTWRGDDCIAYGVSSFGKLGGFLYQNTNSLVTYSSTVNSNKMPIARKFELSSKDLMVRELLLCSVRLNSYNRNEFLKKFGFNYLQIIQPIVAKLVNEGYITLKDGDIEPTRKGVLYSDFVSKIIASSFKDALESDGIEFTY